MERTPKNADLAEQWIGVFLAAGVKLSEADTMRAFRGTSNIPGFLSFDKATQQQILDYTYEKAKKTSAQFMGLPVNLLDKREWERTGPGRLIEEPPKSKGEKAQREAARRFMENP